MAQQLPGAVQLDAASRLRHMRDNGFSLQAMLPSFLHPQRSLNPDFKILDVSNEEQWHRLLSSWPDSQERLEALLVNLSFMRVNAPQFSIRMTGVYFGYLFVWSQGHPLSQHLCSMSTSSSRSSWTVGGSN